jgi:hypothetical protein
MYLRHTIRKKDGKIHRYWCLVRSIRVGRRVVQQTVAQLGELDEEGRLVARALARGLIGAPEQAQLFNDGRADLTVPVRLKGIRVERSRQFGDVYLALALWRGTCLVPLSLPSAAWLSFHSREREPGSAILSLPVRQRPLFASEADSDFSCRLLICATCFDMRPL